MKNYLSSFIKSGLGVILSAIFGLLLLRLISRDLGVSGIAKFGIYRQFIQFCTVFLSWGNGFSVIESFSKAKDKDHFTTNSFKYFQIASLLVSVLIIIFSKPITIALFNDDSNLDLILFSPLVFLGLSNYSFFRFILAAKKHLLASGFLQALPFVLMLFTFSFYKSMNTFFVIAYLISAILSYFVWKNFSNEKISFFEKIERLNDFEKTSIATIVTGAVGFFCPLIVKSISVHFLGMETTGVIEAEFSLVNYFTLAIISGLGTYYLGIVSEHPEDIHFREKIFKFLIPVTAVGLSTLIILEDVLFFHLFGTSIQKFKPELSYFSIGEMLRCANWFFIFTMIGLTFRKTYITFDIISNFAYMGISLLLVQVWPNKASIELGYLIFQAIYLTLNLIFCFKTKIISPKVAISFLIISLLILVPVALGKGFHG